MTEYEHVVLARMGEIALKGLNRGKFEKSLMSNLRNILKPFGRFSIYQNQSRIWIEDVNTDEPILSDPKKINKILDAAACIFGIVSVSPVRKFKGGIEEIMDIAEDITADQLRKKQITTFKVESKRGNKQFPYRSPEICVEVGARILEKFPQLTVDVNHQDMTIHVEVREHCYVYTDKIIGHRGLPVGTSGKAMLLLSGGIDSPVSGYMMASRGMRLEALYFHSFPYTSDRAKDKVVDLAKILTRYCGPINLHVVNFTEIQKYLYENSPQDMLTITMRRVMIRIAQEFARQNDCKALITGESLGQVASQTLEAIALTDEVADMPIFRPLIGVDKDYTISIARRIGTFETSILPYEDCCTVFVAKHPVTRPNARHIKAAESKINVEECVQKGLLSIETISLTGWE